MKKVTRLSLFSQALAALLGLVSVGRVSAESFLKKFRWVPFRHSSKATRNSEQKISPLYLRLDPVAHPFHAHQANIDAQSQLNTHGEIVTRHFQKIEGAVIRGTWIQSIHNVQGEKVFESGEIVEKVPPELRERVQSGWLRKSAAAKAFQKTVPELARASWSSEPRLEVIMNSRRPFALEWSIDFINEEETIAYRAFLDERYNLKGIKAIGSHVEEGLGNVYPKGPKSSFLELKTLSNLDGSGRLSSEDLLVKSARHDDAVSPDLDFRFTPQDTRFDQVQAYFFANQAIKFFKSEFDASPLTQIELKVQVGDRSNAAFYYSNRIRLGSGDDEIYSSLAQDPSVVIHEVGHAFVDRYAGLPSQGEGSSLNEAFADYFAATILETPHIGESSFLLGPFVRSLENNFTAPGDLSHGVYKASQVVSGSLWDLRVAHGAKIADHLAFRTLSRLGSGAILTDFAPSLMIAGEAMGLNPDQLLKTAEILKARGWVF